MNQLNLKFIVIIFLNFTNYFVSAQGCSDAGFCTINSFKPNSSSTFIENKNQIKFGVSIGSSDKSISVFGNYVEYSKQITPDFSIDAKITSLSQTGNGISTFGISDIYLNGNYKLNQKLNIILGTKIPLNDGNKKLENISLPNDYQSSLGTIDLILGISYQIKKVQLMMAIQHPLTQNKNEFFAENYPIDSKLRAFQTTFNYKRSSDILLRFSYPFSFTEKLKFTPSLLPIYHVVNDKYTNILSEENEIKGSQGITLNANTYLDYEINKKSIIQLNLGFPFVVRKSRPDGLTRSFVVNLEYKINF